MKTTKWGYSVAIQISPPRLLFDMQPNGPLHTYNYMYSVDQANNTCIYIWVQYGSPNGPNQPQEMKAGRR